MVTLTSMKVFTAVVEAEEGAVNLNSSPRGTLRLTMPVSFGILHMGPMISAYFKQYPEVKIDIQLMDRRVDLIEEGLDLAVRIGALAESGLIARKLASDSLVVCGSPDYFERHGVLRTPTDLAHHNCLVYTYSKSGEEWKICAPGGSWKCLPTTAMATWAFMPFIRAAPISRPRCAPSSISWRPSWP